MSMQYIDDFVTIMTAKKEAVTSYETCATTKTAPLKSTINTYKCIVSETYSLLSLKLIT